MVRVIFLHPDLGIGGAERLVVDAALALQKKGHYVHFITSHHDTSHCFTETKDGTFPVTVVGDWLPRNIYGKFYAFCAYFRMLYAAFYLTFFSGLQPDVVFCDLISVCIPILKLRISNVLFYCHFPDQLLSSPGSFLKSLYRAPLNWFEERSTGQASKIFVNSNFTAQVFKRTFSHIKARPEVLYPSINTDFFEESNPLPLNEVLKRDLLKGSFVFLSINRYERKKNLSLALDALYILKEKLTAEYWDRIHLVMAGGYDSRVTENVEHYTELVDHAKDLELSDKVTFLKSLSDIHKVSLLSNCNCLIYTPPNEHFGIVPLEAMYFGKPVIAVNSGGPTETILDGKTGLLCESTAEAFASAMMRFVVDENLCANYGKAGQRRMKEMFSFKAFAEHLDSVVQSFFKVKGKRK
uniref:Alpha-1,3/1,6-mannosyltransferase ALG2 n=1 Tax=Timema tahoe TaxID=61484 RepID=A0A7R9NW34_9NEOP|nr:unnamed protein product [Timema tahoe]